MRHLVNWAEHNSELREHAGPRRFLARLNEIQTPTMKKIPDKGAAQVELVILAQFAVFAHNLFFLVGKINLNRGLAFSWHLAPPGNVFSFPVNSIAKIQIFVKFFYKTIDNEHC